MRAAGLALVTWLLFLLPSAASAATLTGGINQAGTITGPTGTVATGTYDYQVSDTATIHNYHLQGPGVDERTGVTTTDSVAWTVTLTDGTYVYQCDVHPFLNGSFTVGAQPPPPPSSPPAPPPPPPPPPAPPPPPPPSATPATLLGSVGPGASIVLATASGARVTSVDAGPYSIVVADRTTSDNFHLIGPGVDRRSGVGGKGTVRWKVRLERGTYRYRSDAHASLSKTFRVRA